MDPLGLFLIFLKDSALGLGGLGSLPMLRQDLVATGLATDAQLVQALAIGRLSTGPTGLWIVSLGYQMAGPTGAALALVAASLPPLLILPATALARRWLLSVQFAGLVRGAALATAGLLCAPGLAIVPPGDVPSWWQVGIGYRGDRGDLPRPSASCRRGGRRALRRFGSRLSS